MTINGLLERGIILITAVLCIAIPVLDFIGALDQVPWISNRIPIYILLSQGVMMTYILIFAHTSEASQKRTGEKILQSIQSSVENELITKPLQMHWEQNRLEIEHIFELITDYVSKPKNRIEDCLEGIYRDIVSGKIPGTNSNFSWDITIGALDYKFTFVWHPTRKGARLLDDTREQQHKEIVNKREPRIKEFIWPNSLISEQFAHVFKDIVSNHMRLTKVYYKDFPKRSLVVFVESHVNLLNRLPQIAHLNINEVRKYLRGF